MRLLIESNIFQTNTENIKLLKERFDPLHILLIEMNTMKFVKELPTIDLDGEDIISLLKSQKITKNVKETIIKNDELSELIFNPDILTQIGNLLLENTSFELDNNFIKPILTDSDLSVLKKVELFNKKYEILEKVEIDEVLLALGKPYSIISQNGKRPLIEKIAPNKQLVKILKDIRFIRLMRTFCYEGQTTSV